MGGLPGGTVTLVLGDVEASTERWEASRDAMRAEMRALNAAVDELVATHGGARPREQGEGDSFVAAFGRASDAVAFADALQCTTPLLVRVGIHTGDVDVVDGGYDGPTIIRAARLRDAGHGGQVLLSQTTAALVADHVALDDLGEHKLKGLNRPERIYQLPGEFPALRLAGERGSMPAHLTAFIGRTLELTQLRDLVKEPGCVTITGAGGSGKTRIALELVARARSWFVDLAAVEAEQGVDGAVAEAVGARVSGGRSLRDAIAGAVGEHSALLVLDNCEHLLPVCSALAADLLSRCSGLTILATSREPLGLDGEVTYRLPSLAESEAVTLFVERATRANPRAQLDASDVVAEICGRLDGMPLAIELAAARMRVFTADQLLDALHDRFRLLTGGARTAMPRQRTLEASVDWSYTLLLEPERVLLRRLAVFAGGFTLDAAVSVAADGDVLEEHHVFDLLVQLVEKSLVVTDDRASGRFAMLETIRHYATARLVEAGESESCRARHFRFFRRLSGGAGRAAVNTDSEHYERLSADEANIRRALQWAADQADGSLTKFVGALVDFWAQSGIRIRDGLEWTERALAAAADDSSRAFLLCNQSELLAGSGRWIEGAELSEEGVMLARRVGDPRLLLNCILRGHMAMSNTTKGVNPELLEEAATLSISLGNRRGLAAARMLAGHVALRDLGELDRAVELLEEARALAQAEGLSRFEAMCEGWIGMAHSLKGGLLSAVPVMTVAAEKLRRQGETFVYSNLLALLAPAKLAAGDEAGARADLDQLDRVADEVDDSMTRLMQHMGHGMHATFAGDWSAAIEQLAFVDGFTGSSGFLGPIFGFLALAEAIAGKSDDAERHAALATNDRDPAGLGASLAVMARVLIARDEREYERAWEMAFAFAARPSFFTPGVLALLGQVTSLLGRHEEAVRLVAAAQAADAAAWVGTEGAFWAALVGYTLPSARAVLGNARVEELWADGSRLSPGDALALVSRGRGSRQRPMLGWDSLTPTEADVARLVAAGASNKDVAAQLFMSVATVKTHLTRIYDKVGVKTRAQLAATSRIGDA